MEIVVAIAAIVAALAAVAGVVFAIAQRREARRRRLTEIADLIDEIRAAAQWGSTASLKRDDAQRKLQGRLTGLDLPKVHDLAHATLHSDDASVALARAAFDEVRVELGAPE